LAAALSLSEHVTVALVATLTAWIASLLTLVALIIDLVLYGWTKHQFQTLNIGADTDTAPGKHTAVIVSDVPASISFLLRFFPSSGCLGFNCALEASNQAHQALFALIHFSRANQLIHSFSFL
jgi:hypothetical protein